MSLPENTLGNTLPPPPEPASLVLARKVVLLSLLMIVAALGLVMLLRQIHVGSLFLAHLFSDMIMGLIAGSSIRWVLSKQTIFLRIISILAFLVGGLELLGWFTGWQIGLGSLRSGQPNADWYSLGQLLLGAGIALLALYAWVPPSPAVIGPDSINRSAPARRRSKKAPPQPSLPEIQSSTQAVEKIPEEPKRKRSSRHKSKLTLSDVVEHRCPYCLEEITPGDPRGTVECKVCHTLHHADCWAITGACQVPHYTT